MKVALTEAMLNIPWVRTAAPILRAMKRSYSLAYLTSRRCTPAQAITVAAQTGYEFVGLRVWPNAPGAPHQPLLGDVAAQRDTLAAARDTGVGVFDIEIVRLNPEFQAHTWDRMLALGQALGARAVLVAGDDPDLSRLADHFAQMCERMRPYGLTANLEFMPWTPVKDAATALDVIRRAGTPVNAAVLVDALHFGRSTTTLDEISALPPTLLQYAQVCDAQAGLDFSPEALIHTAREARLMPGEGNIDLKGLIQALPPTLPLSVEIVHLEREAAIAPLDWARACLEASRRVVE